MKPSEVIEAVQTYGEPEIVALLDGVCGCGALVAAPLDALLRLADAVAKEVEAKNDELAAMKAAVQGADAVADEAEAVALGKAK